MHNELSVAIPFELNNEINDFLIRKDLSEELIFALWSPSYGQKRLAGLIHKLISPKEGDRQRHGNVSFNSQYFERVCSIAAKEQKCGIAFLHSHPAPGWQLMSEDDVIAENKIAGAVIALTDLPLIGMTIGSDGTWSARMWEHIKGKNFNKRWCVSVRIVGTKLDVSFSDHLIPKPKYRELFKRTFTVWGEENHANTARLRVGIVGLGSVGSMIAEILARNGCQHFVLIDFDRVKEHNMDRQLGATERENDIGRLKVEISKRQISRSATAEKIEVEAVPYSIAEKEGYQAALDCDVLFSCVDRPRARKILNHFAYAHLIPVIDGGIEVRFKHGKFSGADWQLQTVAPGRPCLECLKAYDPADVSTEIEGMLDNPSYLKGLPSNHKFLRNENVFLFSVNLASLEVLQFIALATGIAGTTDFGVQRYRYNPGIIEADIEKKCKEMCSMSKLTARGDRFFSHQDRDFTAEAMRLEYKK